MWTIQGQTGKTLDATVRTLAAIGAVTPRVVFRSLAADTLTWSVVLDGLAPGSEIIPELGQDVTMLRSGVRCFCGTVAGVRQTGRVVTVTVSNAWWWLERVFLASPETDGTGATGTRATYALPAQSLTDSFEDLANAAIALGVPMQLGSLATTFSAPELRLNQMSFAQALAEVARVTPDLVTWFDYSVAGLPALRTARRLTGTPVTIDAEVVEAVDLNPLTELQLSRVDIPYLVRSATGAKQFALQTAGTAAAGVPGGRVQLLTVSGDEMDTFLPQDLLDTVAVQSFLWSDVANIHLYDPAIVSMIASNGPFKAGAIASVRGALTVYYGMSNDKVPEVIWFAPKAVRADSGVALPAGTRYWVTTGAPLPEWAVAELGAVEVTITATFVVEEPTSTAGWSPLFSAMMSGAQWGGPTWTNGDQNDDDQWYWLARPVTIKAWLIDTAYATLTDVYRPADYGFAFPPAGFAAGLLAAQNYVPYEGSIEMMAEEAGATRYLGSPINVSHALPAAASMAAMLSSEEWDLESGATTLTLGPPARFSYRDLVNRMRGSSNDNIIYVS
jgi:hypothetical protein